MTIQAEETWADKWQGIQSKFKTCTEECLTSVRSVEACRDALENLFGEIWNFKDWLANDSSVPISKSDIHALLSSQLSFHIRACGDLETLRKHFQADDQKRDFTRLVLRNDRDHPSGYPVIYSVERVYRDSLDVQDEQLRNIDHWEDAYELGTRAINEWRAFLKSHGVNP